jgi:hypothetical protein
MGKRRWRGFHCAGKGEKLILEGDMNKRIDLAVERGEVICRAFTIEAFFAREPFLRDVSCRFRIIV